MSSPASSPPRARLSTQRILVIKLGALGDFVQALGPMAAIRRHHDVADAQAGGPGHAQLTLLTTPAFVGLGRDTGYFDQIWDDGRPRGVMAHVALLRRMSWARFTRVYDLQTSVRSSSYLHQVWPRPEWSGIARGCSHPHTNPHRAQMHTVDRQAEQLRQAGIASIPQADVTALAGTRSARALAGTDAPFGLLVPGAAPHRPAKRWPVERFAALAALWAEHGRRPLVLGTAAEKPQAQAIVAHAPAAIDLTGQTSLNDIVTLALAADAAVGNDTGPMHLAAAAGTPCVVLFGGDSDPARCAPRGPRVRVLAAADISAHATGDVVEALNALALDPVTLKA